MSIVAWLTTTDHQKWFNRNNIYAFIFIVIFLLLISLAKYFRIEILYKFSTSPKLGWIILFWASVAIIAEWIRRKPGNWIIHWMLLFGIFSILIISKTPALAIKASQIIRKINNQDVHLASFSDLQWIGFSYLGFRIIHVLRDHRLGKITKIDLRDFLNYLFFFPAFLSGPIDRVERFLSDIRDINSNKTADLTFGMYRILTGSAKKFIIADSLALLTMTEYTVNRVETSFWMWILVFAYGFRIYFDFSGYTDIAIGLAKIIGISLPENFRSPYQSSNLIVFWNNWHITLTQWFRTYYFNPINRYFKSRKWNIPNNVFIFVMQTSTMILIGLWHGVTSNFIIWGIWHGFGLYINNRWINFVKPIEKSISDKPIFTFSLKILSIMATFIFVSLGWIWFALPSFEASMVVFNKLFGR